MNRLRSPLIALVVLALSGTAVFAARSISDAVNTSSAGLARTTVASGNASQGGTVQAPDASSEREDSTTGTDATTGTDDTTGTRPTDNHGASVSAAAGLSFEDLKAACGGDLKNKGAYISLIARGLYVFDATTGTTACAPAPTTTGTDDTTGTDATTGTKPANNHGASVSAAAHLSLEGLKAACGGDLKNKGAYISRIARGLYVFDATTGTTVGTATCKPATPTTGTTSPATPTTGTTSPDTSAGTDPPKLHGNANADSKRAAHQP
jgi:hypothetical protein